MMSLIKAGPAIKAPTDDESANSQQSATDKSDSQPHGQLPVTASPAAKVPKYNISARLIDQQSVTDKSVSQPHGMPPFTASPAAEAPVDDISVKSGRYAFHQS